MVLSRALLILALAAPLGLAPLGVVMAEEAPGDAIATSGGAGTGAPPTAPPAMAKSLGNADAMPAPDAGPDRRIHGEIGVAVGTGGYRSGYVALSGPIGDRGWGAIALSQTKSDRRGYYDGPYDGPYGSGAYDLMGPRFGSPIDCVEVEREDGMGDPTQATHCPPAGR